MARNCTPCLGQRGQKTYPIWPHRPYKGVHPLGLFWSPRDYGQFFSARQILYKKTLGAVTR